MTSAAGPSPSSTDRASNATPAGASAPDGGWRAQVRAIPRSWWIGAALIALARIVALQLSALPAGEMTGDEPIYDMVARSLLAGQGLLYKGQPWILRPPGWPIVLASLFALPTPDRPTVLLFQGLCDAVTAFTWAGITLAMFGRRVTAAIAFLFVALWPPFLRESLFMQTDPLYAAQLATLTAAFLAFTRQPSMRRGALIGLLAGLAMMVRPPGLIWLGGLVLGWLAWRPANLVRHFAPLVLTAAVALLVISPWTIRNALLFHRFVPLSIGSGEQFFEGACLRTDGRFVRDVTFMELGRRYGEASRAAGHDLNNFDRDRMLMQAGLEQWRLDPARSVAIVFKRIWRLCLVSPHEGDRPLFRGAFLAVLLALYALALPRMFAAWREGDPVRAFPAILGLTLLVSVLGHIPFYTNSRYFEPMRPVLLVLAAATLARALPSRFRA